MRHAIPDDWDGQTFCRFAICWPDSVVWRALLRGLITEPARGFFWDEKTGSIIGVLDQFRQTVDQNIELPEVFMACNDQNIANALQAIATALLSQNNSSNATAIAQCGGGGGSPAISNAAVSVQTFITLGDGTKWPVMGTEPIAELPPSGFPDGYTDEAEYDADKCSKATKLADDFIASIENFATVNWVAGVVGASAILACLVGLITVPYATIPLLLFALCGNIGITTALSAFADELQNRRKDLICILYQGDTVEIIITQIAEFLDVIIASIDPVAAIGIALKNIALWLMNGDTLNALFNSAAKQAYPNANCSSCEIGWVLYNGGTIEEAEENVWIFTPTENTTCDGQNNNHAWSFSGERISYGVAVPGNWTIQLETGGLNNTGEPAGDSCNFIYRGFSCGGNEFHIRQMTPPSWPVTCSSATIRSNTFFTLRITIENEGEVEC